MKTKQVIYAFIDSQNLNLGVQSQGWKIDYKKFRLYLKNKYNVEQAFVFIGLVRGNDELYKQLQRAGFILIFKPTVRYFENGKQTVKGNVDAELVLHAAAIEYENYDKAIIVSGDGDFACLIEYLSKKHKLSHVFAPSKKYSKLLEPNGRYIVHMWRLRKILEYKKDRHQRSVETLGLSGHGDTIKIVANNSKKVNANRTSRRGKKS